MENERHIVLFDFQMELNAVAQGLHSYYVMLSPENNAKKALAPAMFLLDRLVEELDYALKHKEVEEVWS